MNTKLLTALALTTALVGVGIPHAQAAQTFNVIVPSVNQTFTDSSGNTDNLNIPSNLTIGTLTVTPANSGPTVAAIGSVKDCGSGVTTCAGGGLALTSGDHLLVKVSSDQTIAATPLTITGTGTISSCATMTNGSVSYNSGGGHIYFEMCSITASGTATGVVAHLAAATSFYAEVQAFDIHSGSDHGNGASASGSSASPSVTTAAGSGGQPSVNALIFATTENSGGATVSGTSGWTVDFNNGFGSLIQHKTLGVAGAVTASMPLSGSDSWGAVIVAIQ